jgi:SRSO17 transposase
MNLGQAHYLVLQAPTLDLWPDTTKSSKFVIQVGIQNSDLKFLLKWKPNDTTRQQMRTGAREISAYHSVKLR